MTRWAVRFRAGLLAAVVLLLALTGYTGFTAFFYAAAHYTTGAYTGLEAHWQSNQLAALLKYQLTDRASVYGGLRYVTSSATIYIPAQMLNPIGPYTASAASDSQLGYVVGAAYEIPDIALRVGLTYESSITHSFATASALAHLDRQRAHITTR